MEQTDPIIHLLQAMDYEAEILLQDEEYTDILCFNAQTFYLLVLARQCKQLSIWGFAKRIGNPMDAEATYVRVIPIQCAEVPILTMSRLQKEFRLVDAGLKRFFRHCDGLSYPVAPFEAKMVKRQYTS